jgi:hypothetical protein
MSLPERQSFNQLQFLRSRQARVRLRTEPRDPHHPLHNAPPSVSDLAIIIYN